MAKKKKYGRQQPSMSQNPRHNHNHDALSKAARDGDEKEIKLVLEQEYIDPDAKDRRGQTALSYAAEHGYEKVVELLLKHEEVDADSVDDYGRTPLSQAAGGGHDQVVEMLIKQDSVDPNSKDNRGKTPLLWAVKAHLLALRNQYGPRTGHYAVVNLLLTCERVNVNCRNSNGRVPLSHAAACGNGELVELLLEHQKIDADSVDDYGRTPLSQAAGGGHDQVVEMLIKQDSVDPNSKDNDGKTPLLWAVKAHSHGYQNPWGSQTGYYAAAKLLLVCEKIDPNCRDIDGRTPLSHAAGNGNGELVELLLKHEKVDADSVDIHGRTPLSRAAGGGHNNVVHMMIGRPDVVSDSRDIVGRTPLSWSVAYSEDFGASMDTGHQRYEVTRLLLREDSVDANSRDNEGRIPLSWAIQHLLPSDKWGNGLDIYLIDLQLNPLLEKTINLDSKDNNGRTLLSRAAEIGNKRVVERLLKQERIEADLKDDDGRTPLSRAAEQGHQAVVLLLLKQARLNVDSSDNHDRTPLWWASKAGYEVVVESLLASNKVDPGSMDKDDHSPLSCAIENQDEAIVKLLINRDKTTLHKMVQKGRLAPLQLLLKSGGEVNIKDIDGRTPLHTAAASGHVNIAEELICWEADIDSEDTNGITPLQVALAHKQQDIIRLLLHHSAEATGIELSKWLQAYNREALDGILEFSYMSCKEKSVRFVPESRVNMLTQMEPMRRLSIYANYPAWSRCLGYNPKDTLERDKSDIHHDVQIHKNHVSIYVLAAFPREDQETDQRSSLMSLWCEHAIAWTMIPPSKPKDGSCWISIDHFSTLPYVWIPDNGADFFTLFVRKLKKSWLDLCTTAEDRLSQRRFEQLCAKGNSSELIHRLAEDAQECAKLRSILRGQVQTAKNFIVKYCRSYDQHKGSRTMQSAIDEFSADVNDYITRLEQTVKDLLQFEFAWVSINEAHKSTSIATSIQRLSWITFIFLPAMFASSLFGMNVDILASNPDWRWYLLFGGGCLTLTVLVWLIFKYGRIEALVERYLGGRFRQPSPSSTAFSQLLKKDQPTLPM